jgi:hypothetical protein
MMMTMYVNVKGKCLGEGGESVGRGGERKGH